MDIFITGMGAVKRKIATSVNPKLKIMVTDDIIKASLSVGPKKNKAVFRLGERYEVEANDVPSTVGIGTVKSELNFTHLCSS